MSPYPRSSQKTKTMLGFDDSPVAASERNKNAEKKRRNLGIMVIVFLYVKGLSRISARLFFF